MPFSIENFGGLHSLVSNKTGRGIPLKVYGNIPEEERLTAVQSFGLFESSSPDFNKYYPEVTAKDLEPQDEDFVYPIFRALSKVIVNKWGPIDFTQGNILEESAPLLIGQSLFTNHDQVVGNEVGVIVDSFYENARTQKGIKIPGGINVKTKLDGKSNPKLIRSIMMDPPAIHSTSVTVAFDWEQSHPQMSRDEFFAKLGQLDAKGKLIRRVVTRIQRYDELSFVSHGADPFAQQVRDGKIVNPEYSARVYKFEEGDNRKIYHYISYKALDKDTVSMSQDSTILDNPKLEEKPTKQKLNENRMNQALLAFLIAQFAMDSTSTEEQVTAKLQAELPGLIADKAALAKAQNSLIAVQTELGALKAKYPEGSKVLGKEDEELLAVGKTSLRATREECLRLYHISIGGEAKADASITKMVAEAGFETLVALTKQYRAAVEKLHPGKCKKCGSTDVSRASSADPESGVASHSGTETPETPTVRDTQEVAQEIYKKATSFSAEKIHGVINKPNQ